MKLTQDVVKTFKSDEKAYGTKVALYNVLWRNAAGLLFDLGVKGVKTNGRKKAGSGRKRKRA